MQFETTDYRCPKCLGGLVLMDAGRGCRECRLNFPIRDGITDFRCARRDYYFNPVPPAEMDRLTRNITPENWASTIRAFMRQVKLNPGWLDNLVSDGRYAWKLMLDLSPDTVLLDLGCGLGNLTTNLAPYVSKVYAMDLTYPRLEFARKRFELFNPEDKINLLAAGDAEHLPFANDSLDCVVLSGVLEWVGEGDTSAFERGSKARRAFRMLSHHFGARNPRAIQLAFLKEIRRALKPRGQLYVAIENRLNWEYFTGRPDHHSGLKFASLLPRLMANFYSILASRRPYRTYTYSIPGYRRLFREAGFGTVEFLGLSQGYSFLQEILPLEGEFPRWVPDKPRGLKEAVKRHKYFVPAYGVVASAAPRPWRRLQDGMLKRIEHDLDRGALTLSSCEITEKDKVVILGSAGGFGIVIRIPCSSAAKRCEDNAFALLTSLRGHAALTEIVPRALSQGTVEGIRFFAESRIAGIPLRTVIRSRGRTTMLAQVAMLLEKLSASCTSHTLTGKLYDTHVTRHLADLREIVSDAGLRERMEVYFRDRLDGIRISVGLTHGDFGVNNIFAADSTITGLIDWEAGATAGLPVLDAINYLTSAQHLFDRSSRLGTTVPLLASGKWPVPEEKALLEAHYARCGVDPTCHEALVYLAWLNGVSYRLQYRLGYDPQAIDTHVTQVLKAMPLS